MKRLDIRLRYIHLAIPVLALFAVWYFKFRMMER